MIGRPLRVHDNPMWVIEAANEGVRARGHHSNFVSLRAGTTVAVRAAP
jgi:hypothetical protein